METYANALLYGHTLFCWAGTFRNNLWSIVKDQKHNVMDTVSSLSSGLTNIIKDSLGLAVVLVSYPFLLDLPCYF